MKTLKEILMEAERERRAVGHFNVSDSVALRAIFESARDLGLPVMIGVSEGEREFFGTRQVAALVKSFRDEYDYPIFLNADHTHSLEKIKEAAEAGFDEVLFDGSKLSLGDNIAQTKQAVEIAKSVNPGIIVEGEIGYIGSASEILKTTPEGAALDAKNFTTPEEAVQFVKETGVDVLAPAVGNMHGLLASMVSGETRKRLDIERIKKIKEATGIFMTLHGGSGTADEDFVAAVRAGVTIVHINTEIRLAWRNGMEKGLKEHPDEVAPYKIYPAAFDAIQSVVRERLALFSGK